MTFLVCEEIVALSRNRLNDTPNTAQVNRIGTITGNALSTLLTHKNLRASQSCSHTDTIRKAFSTSATDATYFAATDPQNNIQDALVELWSGE